ncbi:MAG: AraD1 family protein [Arenicella sp.]
MRTIQYIQINKEVESIALGKVIDNETIQPVKVVGGIYAAAQQAIAAGMRLKDWIDANLQPITVSYQDIVDGGYLLPPVTHPDPSKCLVSGTGLTHLGSADARDNMHARINESTEAEMTDSMKIFKLGVENGRPVDGEIGALPEWFYKGDGHTLVAPGKELPSHGFSLDAGEEPELVGLYIIADDGTPCRLGFAIGNEFSDHVTEKGNYLWLAHSKLQYSSFGPELLIGELPQDLSGESAIYRAGEKIWSKPFLTGEENMSHSINNLEHHHFKYSQFLQPGNMHVHYFGTSTLSFGDGVVTQEEDVFEISIPGFGRALRNAVSKSEDPGLVAVKAL